MCVCVCARDSCCDLVPPGVHQVEFFVNLASVGTTLRARLVSLLPFYCCGADCGYLTYSLAPTTVVCSVAVRQESFYVYTRVVDVGMFRLRFSSTPG